MKVRSFIQKKGISVAITITVLLVVFSVLLSFYVRSQIDQFNYTKEQVTRANTQIEQIRAHINLMDMAVRGYLLVPTDGMLKPYHDGGRLLFSSLDTLGMVLREQNYPNQEEHQKSRQVINTYQEVLVDMIELAENGQVAAAVKLLEKDLGYDAWAVYNKHLIDVANFENALYVDARREYKRVVDFSAVMQVILLLLGAPTLFFVMHQINRASRDRRRLFEELEESQRTHLFDDKRVSEAQEERTIISSLIENLGRASHFIKRISEGDYTVKWEGLNEENRSANQENLAGALVQMREQMKAVKQEDQQRLWSTEGLSKVAEITRKHQEDIQQLADTLLSYLVSYTGANQGSLFFLQEEVGEEPRLVLSACYAYDKKKYADKTVKLGQGLVGQTFLEKKTLHLVQVPDQYVSITSGLGEATPTTLLLVPLIFNEQVMGILEMAAFDKFASHQIVFLESVGEVIASAVATVRINSRTKVLLEQSQEGTEALRAQEEEMRQNMEELQATQEEMERKAQEYEAVIEEQQKKIRQLERTEV